jgi:hypothetical protein
MTKKEACALLGISPKTLQRRMSKGVYKFTRAGEGQYAELSFSHADLGLTEPAPVPTPVLEIAPAAPVPTPELAPTFALAPLGPVELRREADERFAQDYKRGEVADSAGNTINGTNERWPTKGIQSLLGPMKPKPKEKFSCDAHMTLQNRPTMIGVDGESVLHAGSDNHPMQQGRTNVGAKPKPQHPNQSRQDMLNAIWADIGREYSR